MPIKTRLTDCLDRASRALVLGGEAMGLIDDVLPAGAIVERMVAEAEAARAAGARRVMR